MYAYNKYTEYIRSGERQSIRRINCTRLYGEYIFIIGIRELAIPTNTCLLTFKIENGMRRN